MSDHELATTDSLRLQQLLVSIESRKLSCCIRVFSKARKSRSALLVYRGRLIGCVFGQKGLSQQLFGKPALERILDELLTTGNFIDAYSLSDEMVLAAASLFHSGLHDVFKGASPARVFTCCAQMMMRNRRTGCLVVNSGSASTDCITYICDGQIAGVYSVADGWLTKTQTAALNCLDYVADPQVLISTLPISCDEASVLTESLSGLG